MPSTGENEVHGPTAADMKYGIENTKDVIDALSKIIVAVVSLIALFKGGKLTIWGAIKIAAGTLMGSLFGSKDGSLVGQIESVIAEVKEGLESLKAVPNEVKDLDPEEAREIGVLFTNSAVDVWSTLAEGK